MNSDKILLYLVDLFTSYLDELNSLPRNDFIHGEMTAYVETLEIIQKYQKNIIEKLNFVIEEKYKI